MIGEVLRELGVVLIFAIPLTVSLGTLLDIAHWDSWVWAMAEKSRIFWLCAVAFGVMSVIGGLLICGAYLARVRPVLRRVSSGDLALRSSDVT